MGRNISTVESGLGSSKNTSLVIPGASGIHTTPVFAKAGWHPNLDSNAFNVQYLNANLHGVTPFTSGTWGLPGYANVNGRIPYGLGQNLGWWDQDQGLADVRPWLDVRNYPSSSSDYGNFAYTPRSGELGNDIINVTRSMTLMPWYARARSQHGAWHNYRFVNGDYPTSERVLLMDGGVLHSLPRYRLQTLGADGAVGDAYRRTIGMTASNTLNSQTGSATYNHRRGELAVVASSGSTNRRFVIRLYAVTLDERLDVSALPNDPIIETEVTLDASVWPRWNNEARFRVTPVLLDNGDIVLVGFHSASSTSGSEGLRAVRLARNPDNTFVAPSSPTSSLATHGATYCMDNDSTWLGMKTMQSKNGRFVMCFAQYYYYGAGFVGLVVDRRTGTITPLSHTDTSWGYQALHDGDDGFLIYRQGYDYEQAGWNSTEAFRYAPKSDGVMALRAVVPVTKRIWPYNSSYTNTYSALLEVLP